VPVELRDTLPSPTQTLNVGADANRYDTLFARFLNLAGPTGGTAYGAQMLYRGNSNPGGLRFYRGRDTAGANTVVQSGDLIGYIDSLGYDGAAYQTVARIQMAVDGTPGANDMPGRLEFHTTPDGSSGLSERWRIDNAGMLRPASDSTVDLGLPATRVRAVYSDDDISVTPTTGTNVASTTDVTLASKTVENLAAGDCVAIDAWIAITNNSGATRTYAATLDIGTTWDNEFQLVNGTNGSTLRYLVHINSVITIMSTSLALIVVQMWGAAAGTAAGYDPGTTWNATASDIAWNSVASNLTGSQTIGLKLRSNSATATQTCDVLMMRCERVRP